MRVTACWRWERVKIRKRTRRRPSIYSRVLGMRMLFITDALDGVTVIIWCNPAITRACVTAHLARRFIYSFVALLFFSLLFIFWFLFWLLYLAAEAALSRHNKEKGLYMFYIT